MYSTSYDDTFFFFANFQAIFVELGLKAGPRKDFYGDISRLFL